MTSAVYGGEVRVFPCSECRSRKISERYSRNNYDRQLLFIDDTTGCPTADLNSMIDLCLITVIGCVGRAEVDRLWIRHLFRNSSGDFGGINFAGLQYQI
mmetsp:Transcript_24435/g.40323  ORF Transcript_24435/g.40323 Transcript_24435/m.40323 type:complete len:99 (-) Transcript_24435:16-312(-)